MQCWECSRYTNTQNCSVYRKFHSTGLIFIDFKAQEMSGDYNSTLFNISEELVEENLHGLKFLFKDHISGKKLSGINESLELFTILDEKRLISEANPSLLRAALEKIGRNDLASKLKKCSSNKVLSTFRLLLYDIASDMYPNDIPKAIYLLPISKGKGERIKNALDLFFLLEQMNVLSVKDTSCLQKSLKKIGRNDLASQLSKFHDRQDAVGRNHQGQDLQQTLSDSDEDMEATASCSKPLSRPPPKKDVKQGQKKTREDGSDLDVDGPAPKRKVSKLSKMFEGALGKKTPDRERLADTKLLLEAAQSVGLIGQNGTGFVVGGCIMTTAHVFKEALMISIENCHCADDYVQCVQERLQQFVLNITFTLGSQLRIFRLTRVRYMSIELDACVIQTEPKPDYPLPAPFTRFLDDDKILFDFLGHDNAELDISRDRRCYTITSREDFKRMKMKLQTLGVDDDHLSVYDAFGRDPNFVEFHCSMKNGASGSPGVVVHNGEVYVCTMLRAGFPENPEKIPLPEELCVEQGVRMRALRESIYSFDEQLCRQIFPW